MKSSAASSAIAVHCVSISSLTGRGINLEAADKPQRQALLDGISYVLATYGTHVNNTSAAHAAALATVSETDTMDDGEEDGMLGKPRSGSNVTLSSQDMLTLLNHDSVLHMTQGTHFIQYTPSSLTIPNPTVTRTDIFAFYKPDIHIGYLLWTLRTAEGVSIPNTNHAVPLRCITHLYVG